MSVSKELETEPAAKKTVNKIFDNSDLIWLAAWILTRLLMFTLWSTNEKIVFSDVQYYFFQCKNSLANGTEALVEYPAPIAWLFKLLLVITGSNEGLYIALYVLIMLVLDFFITRYLWKQLSKISAFYWIIFVFFLGSMIFFRFDLVPAIAMTLGLVWAFKKPFASGAAIAVGAASKLWPALLISVLLGRSNNAKKRGLGFLIVGGILGLLSLLISGWDRSISPLTWQSDRGLQIESVPATYLMAKRVFGFSDLYQVGMSKYNAVEIIGPGRDIWLLLSDLAMAFTIILVLGFFWLIALGGIGLPDHSISNVTEKEGSQLHKRTIVLASLAIILAMIVSNKTLSPQYLIWLVGPLAILTSMSGPGTRFNQLMAATGLLCAGLTHVIFPLAYPGISGTPPSIEVTMVLVIRNLLLVAMTVACTFEAIKCALALGRPSSSEQLESAH